MYPIALGIAAVAAWALSGCGSGKLTQDINENDAGSDAEPDTKDIPRFNGTGGRNGTGGTGGTGGRSSTGGTGGTGGSGGLSGSSGAAGFGGSGTGGIRDAGVDQFVPDSGGPQSVAYHFGMIYGSNPITGVNGSGTLIFTGPDHCQLVGGTFQAETQNGDSFGMSVDLSGTQNMNFCGSQVSLPLNGGIFQGVTWMLSNRSDDPATKDSYEITSCNAPANSSVENCSGALNISTP